MTYEDIADSREAERGKGLALSPSQVQARRTGALQQSGGTTMHGRRRISQCLNALRLFDAHGSTAHPTHGLSPPGRPRWIHPATIDPFKTPAAPATGSSRQPDLAQLDPLETSGEHAIGENPQQAVCGDEP